MKNLFNPKKKAFTLAEVMLTVVILSVIAIVVMPIITASRPSNEKVLLKKAYNATEQVVAELSGNERFYPSDITLKDVNSTSFANNTSPSGFLNYRYPANDSMLEYTIQESFAGTATSKGCNCYDTTHNKLSMLFCCSLKTVNKRGGTVCTTSSNKTTCDFETTDGITWHTVDVSQTSTDLTKPVFTITVDVDNRWGGRHKEITDAGYKKTRFIFEVYYDGKLKVDSTAQDILADSLSNKRLNY